MKNIQLLEQRKRNLRAKQRAILAVAHHDQRDTLDSIEVRGVESVQAQIDATDREIATLKGYEARGYERRDIPPAGDGHQHQAVPNADALARERADQLERAGHANPTVAAIRGAQMGVRRDTASVNEPKAYAEGNGQSYFRDLIRVQRQLDDTGEAAERLRRHAQDVAESRDMDTTDGSGGYFVPPTWLVDRFVPKARAGRAFADTCTRLALPPGTNSINIPKVDTGTATGIQSADNTQVTEQDMDDLAIEAKVRTIAGQTDVAIQLLDQSPISFDEVIFRDLIADYNTKVDLQVLAGSGTNGQVLGVNNTTGIDTIAVTAQSVTALYAAIADAIQRINTSRYLPPEHIVMHPRRWAALTAAVDGDERPLVLPAAASTNAVATLAGVGAEQVVGQLQGLPVITDPNIATNLGTGTDEDVIYVQRSSDLMLFESGIRSRVLPDVGSGTLTVRLQVYGYIAFTAERYPESVVQITGLTPPSFQPTAE